MSKLTPETIEAIEIRAKKGYEHWLSSTEVQYSPEAAEDVNNLLRELHELWNNTSAIEKISIPKLKTEISALEAENAEAKANVKMLLDELIAMRDYYVLPDRDTSALDAVLYSAHVFLKGESK